MLRLTGVNGNEGVLHIPQISKAGATPSDGLMSNIRDTHWVGSYLSTETQSVYSTAPIPADGANIQIVSYEKDY